MDEANLYQNFYLWLGVATILIIAAAGLLIMVWMAARRILRLATAALSIVKEIRANTNSIWGLQKTNEVAINILEGAKAIETHAGMVVEAMHEADNN